jgi:hypothetical protein
MPDRSSQFIALTRMAATAGTALAMLVGCSAAAWPQDTAPAQQDRGGLVDEIGRLFDRLPKLKSPSETIDDLNTSARDAAGALSNLTRPSLVSGRTKCPISANGAPDCKAASDRLCQAKGFKEGKSLASDSAETCSARVLIPGRPRKPGDCRTDTYVTSALCQ